MYTKFHLKTSFNQLRNTEKRLYVIFHFWNISHQIHNLHIEISMYTKFQLRIPIFNHIINGFLGEILHIEFVFCMFKLAFIPIFFSKCHLVKWKMQKISYMKYFTFEIFHIKFEIYTSKLVCIPNFSSEYPYLTILWMVSFLNEIFHISPIWNIPHWVQILHDGISIQGGWKVRRQLFKNKNLGTIFPLWFYIMTLYYSPFNSVYKHLFLSFIILI